MTHTHTHTPPPHPPGARERARGLGGFLFECEYEADPSGLTPEELDVLSAAKSDGFLVRSGQRIVVLLAWQTWCRRSGRACIVGIKTARHGIIEIDGNEVARVAVNDLETEAARVVRENASRTLFEGVL